MFRSWQKAASCVIRPAWEVTTVSPAQSGKISCGSWLPRPSPRWLLSAKEHQRPPDVTSLRRQTSDRLHAVKFSALGVCEAARLVDVSGRDKVSGSTPGTMPVNTPFPICVIARDLKKAYYQGCEMIGSHRSYACNILAFLARSQLMQDSAIEDYAGRR